MRKAAQAWLRSLGVVLALAVLMSPTRGADSQQETLLVFAAASLTNVLEEVGTAYTAQTQQPVKFSFAASSALARQIEAGGRADVFFSADAEWMDYLQLRNLIDRSTRYDVVGNRLVLIAPLDSKTELKIQKDFALAGALGSGRLATGDPDTVPVGRYARSALTSLGVWDEVVDRLVRADNVRSALAFVARGEAPLGIVYETDAKVEKQVRVVDVFPPSSHQPITYPVAAIARARPGADRFVKFLRDPAAERAFLKHGFKPLHAR